MASLRGTYGIGLVEASRLPLGELCDMVAWLPPGCALWRSFGGPAALSDESRHLRSVIFALEVLDYRARKSKGQKPKPMDDPPFAHERRAEADRMSRKADAYMRRQQNKS